MSVLTVAKRVARVVGIEEPDTVVGNTRRSVVELSNVMREMARRITDGYDWQTLSKVHTINGDGSTIEWPLPDDYDRMLVKASVWSSSLETALSPISDLDTWLELEVESFDFVINAWTIYGERMHIKPALSSGVTAQFFYQSNRLFESQGGGTLTEFAADDDTYRINEDLWALGTIYQWRNNKGQPYAEDMADYEELKSRLVTRDRGSRMLRIGQPRIPNEAQIAYPQSITG